MSPTSGDLPLLPSGASGHTLGRTQSTELAPALSASPRADAAIPCSHRGMTLLQLHEVWEQVEDRCEREQWTNIHGEPLTPDNVNMYDIVKYVIKPATQSLKCSYVELVAGEGSSNAAAQRPCWFVSHWWGHSTHLFLRCLEQHAADHGLDEASTSYWVCAFAINQHELTGDVRADPSASAFYRAIELVEGRVVMILDTECRTLTRIWCCFETYLGLANVFELYTPMAPGHGYAAILDMSKFGSIGNAVGAEGFRGSEWIAEVYKRLPLLTGRRAVGITNGPAKVDQERPMCQVLRQSYFPPSLLRACFSTRVQDGDATVADDKRHILNFMVGRRSGDELDMPPSLDDPAFDAPNAMLHGNVAAAGWRVLLESGDDMRPCGDALRSSRLHTVGMCFRGCSAFTDEQAALLGRSLPLTLEELRLEITGSGATHAGGNALLIDSVIARLHLPSLRVLEMNDCLLRCSLPEAIGECTQLRSLILSGNQLHGRMPAALGKCTSLRRLHMQNNQLSGRLPPELGSCASLESLRLNGNQLDGEIPPALASCTLLTSVFLHKNQLQGCVPEALGGLTKLTAIYVDAPLLVGGSNGSPWELGGLPESLRARHESGSLDVNVPRAAVARGGSLRELPERTFCTEHKFAEDTPKPFWSAWGEWWGKRAAETNKWLLSGLSCTGGRKAKSG